MASGCYHGNRLPRADRDDQPIVVKPFSGQLYRTQTACPGCEPAVTVGRLSARERWRTLATEPLTRRSVSRTA